MLNDFTLPPRNGGAPKHALIFSHGLGDRGDGGLLEICRAWQTALPDCAFFCPDAPFPLDGAPPDFDGRQWFSLQDRTPQKVYEGTKMAAPYLNNYIDQVLVKTGLPIGKLALAGFSQGTMMSLYVAPRRPEPVACVLGYAGSLVGAETLIAEKKCAPPVFLAHGVEDDIVPFAAMALAGQGLKAAGVPVTTVACPNLDHGIDDRGLAEGMTFLQKYLA